MDIRHCSCEGNHVWNGCYVVMEDNDSCSANYHRPGASTEETVRIDKLGYHQPTSPGTTGPARIPVLSGNFTKISICFAEAWSIIVYLHKTSFYNPFRTRATWKTHHEQRFEDVGRNVHSVNRLVQRWAEPTQGYLQISSASRGPHQQLPRSSSNGMEAKWFARGDNTFDIFWHHHCNPTKDEARPPTLATNSGNQLEIIMRRKRRGGIVDFSLR